MEFTPNIPAGWLEEFKKSLLRPKPDTAQSVPPVSSPVDLATARLAEPDTERFLRTSSPAAPPMSAQIDSSMTEVPGARPDSSDLASMRLQNAPIASHYTPRPEYQQAHKPGEPIGLGQRFLHTLKGVGLGALHGSQYGLPGMIGGAAAGGIGAGVNPEFFHKLKYESQTLPMWRQRVGDEMEIGKAEQGAQESEARIKNIGVDNDLASRRLKMDEELRRGAGEDRDLAREDRAYQTWLEYGDPNKPLSVDEAKRLGRPQLVGQASPATRRVAKGPVTEYSKTEVREDGVEYGLRKDTGKWEPTTDTTGKPFKRYQPPRHDPNELTPYQKVSDARAQEREDRAKRKEQQQRISVAETALTTAQNAINRARTISGGTAKNVAAPEQIEEAWANAHAAVQLAVASHPDLLEGGEGEGGYPYLKWKDGKKPSVSARSAPAQTITQSEYQQQVQKHGQAKVDEWLRGKGISVQ